MRNETLEQNQEEMYNQVSAKYNFTCHGAGATTYEKPEIEALLPGIRLHFLRYGLFNRNGSLNDTTDVDAPKNYTEKAVLIKGEKSEISKVKKDDHNETEPTTILDEVEILALEELPSMENFYVGRTALTMGYIYLINDENPDDYYELEIDEYGMLSHVLWKYNKDKNGEYLDIRKATGEKILYKIVQPGKKLWMAYSTTQWSRAYHNELNTNANKRKERMKLIDCSGFKKEENNPHEFAIPYTDVRAVFKNDDPYIQSLHKILDEIHADEKRQDSIGDNELLEDMFITLHDPIGCATDVGEVLADKIADLEAFTEALATGNAPQKIKNTILEGKPRKKAPKGSDQEQIEALFATAATTYQLVYNDDDMEDDYDGGKIGFWNLETDGNGIRKEKIIAALGVKERKKLREKIVPFRKEFCNVLQSEYYNNYYKGIHEGGFTDLLQNKTLAIQHIILLRTNPDHIDKHLDLAKDRGKYPQDLQQQVNEVNTFYESLLSDCDETPLVQMLNTNLDMDYLDDKQGVLSAALIDDLANKTATLISESLDAFIGLSVANKVNWEFTFNRLKTFKHKGSAVFQLRMKELEAELAKNAMLLDRSRVQFVGYKNGNRLVKIKAAQGIELVDEYNPKGQNKLRLDVETIPAKSSKQVKGAQKIFNSVHFTGALALLQIANISFAVRQVGKDQDFKSVINLGGIGSELGAAILHYQRSKLILKKAAKQTILNTYNKAKFAGNVGGGITAAVCVWESYDAFSVRDRDSALAWGGAAAAFATGIFVTGPAGWVIGGIGVGLVFLANYLKDTPLQAYFKHFILSDAAALKKKDIEPWEYSKQLYTERIDLLDDPDAPYHTFEDMRVAHQKLLDLIICSDMAIAPYKLSNARSMQIGHEDGANATLTIKDVSVFKIQTSFRQFLQHEDQYEYRIFITNNKSSYVKELDLRNSNNKISIIKDDRDIPAVEMLVHVPAEVHEVCKRRENRLSLYQLVLVCRLKIDEDKYYPYTYVGDDRWMAVKTGLTTSRIHNLKNMEGLLFKPTFLQNEGEMYRKNVKVGTLAEIKAWGKKWELKI